MSNKIIVSTQAPSPRKQNLIVLFILFLFILSLFVQGCKNDIPEQELEVGSSAPDFTLPALTGEATNLKNYLDGNNVFLLFWSSSCSSCKETMTALEEVYKERHGEGFSVIAVNVFQKREDIEKYSKRLNLTYPLLLDQKGSVAGLYEVYAIPVTYILGESGKILYKFLGDMTKEKVESLVKEFWK